MTSENRMGAIGALEERWRDCERCSLSKTRKRLVQWRGNPWARVVLIGASPAKEDEASGEAFSGRAGKYLDTLIFEAGQDPYTDVFMVNRLACVTPKARQPRDQELAKCAPRLKSLAIKHIRPAVVVLLGAVAGRLAGKNVQREGGKKVFRLGFSFKAAEPHSCRALVTYPPEYLLRSGTTQRVQFIRDIEKAFRIARKVGEE